MGKKKFLKVSLKGDNNKKKTGWETFLNDELHVYFSPTLGCSDMDYGKFQTYVRVG